MVVVVVAAAGAGVVVVVVVVVVGGGLAISYIHRSYMYRATSNFAWTEPSSDQLTAIHLTLSSPPTATANKSTNSRTTWPNAKEKT